jgi:GT2 family glycosyltransferase
MVNFDYDRPQEVDQVMGAALLTRREALEKARRMDENFFLYFEEVDLCRRLRAAGYSIWYNPRASIVHLGGASFEQSGGEARFWLLKSQLYYFRKHCAHRSVARFEMIFKPLVLMGEACGLVSTGIELLAARLWPTSPRRKERKAARWRRKIDFFTRFLPRFLREG